MKTFDYNAVDIFDADGSGHVMTCCNAADCLPAGVVPSVPGETDGIQEAQGTRFDLMPIFADSEMDSYPVCDSCGHEHDYVSLTEDGELDAAYRENERRDFGTRKEFDRVQPALVRRGL